MWSHDYASVLIPLSANWFPFVIFFPNYQLPNCVFHFTFTFPVRDSNWKVQMTFCDASLGNFEEREEVGNRGRYLRTLAEILGIWKGVNTREYFNRMCRPREFINVCIFVRKKNYQETFGNGINKNYLRNNVCSTKFHFSCFLMILYLLFQS